MKKVLVSVSMLLLISLLSACNQDEASSTSEEEAVTAVETVQVVKDDLVVERKVYGRTAAESLTPIMLQMPGEVDSVEISSGDKVNKDDTVVTLKTEMGNQKIKAPKTGEIVEFTAKEGDFVSEADPLAMIAKMDEMTINIAVTANVRALLTKDDKLSAMIEGEEYEAKVTSISKMPDETGLYPIEANVKNEDKDILPGMIATLHIPEVQVEESTIVPTEAIVEDSDGTFIYIVKDDHAEKIEVDVEVTQSDRTAIKGEVSTDDQIVINGQLTLIDGSKVNVVKEGE